MCLAGEAARQKEREREREIALCEAKQQGVESGDKRGTKGGGGEGVWGKNSIVFYGTGSVHCNFQTL